MNKFLFFILLQPCLSAGQLSNDLENRLFELPDVIFKKTEPPKNYPAEVYELKIRQPLDHTHPEQGHFYQRVFLTHKGYDRPMVIVTEGYERKSNRLYELTTLLDANQLDVEHRFFGESMPDSMDYQYLTLEQATADLHRVNLIFRQIYTGKWLSTGISKGGQTTIYYRYFYPEDVDVSVPYVAPLNLELEEKRIYDFLDTIGSRECRAKIKDVQFRLLKNREQVLPMLRWFAKGANLRFTYLTLEEAFEYSILEYPFSFWQLGHDCAKIPPATVPLDSAVSYLLTVSGIDFFADKGMEEYASHYYQAGTQMGYYSYETEDFKGLLKALPMQPHPSAVFMPGKLPMTFDGNLPDKVFNWLESNGHRFIYINGATDTWSATAVPPSGKVDALWFFLKGKDHARARIANMTADEKGKMTTALERWLELKIDKTKLEP